MKTKGILLILTVLLFSSCIIKSLQPFYTPSSLSKNDVLIGNWSDQKEGVWEINSFEAEYKMQKNKENILSFINDIDKKYIEGYYANYERKGKNAQFIIMPFKIENQYFLDFIPFLLTNKSVNDLAFAHLQASHSVAKLDIEKDGTVSFSWLSEGKVTELIENETIKIKHEKMGLDETPFLTASSYELNTFLKKYMAANLEDKWSESDKLTLTKINAKP
jgi:hypothetical protein